MGYAHDCLLDYNDAVETQSKVVYMYTYWLQLLKNANFSADKSPKS